MDGFRFTCLPGCTECCRRRGFVYLSERDLRRAARRLRLEPAEFERRYVYRTRHLLRLRKPRHSECPFLGEKGCRLHPDKPTQCRVYPFWPELVEEPAHWRAEKEHCPGIGAGPLIQVGTALEASREMRAAYPSLYARQPKPRHRPDSVTARERSTT